MELKYPGKDRVCKNCLYRGDIFDANEITRRTYSTAPAEMFPPEWKTTCCRFAFPMPSLRELGNYCGDGLWRVARPDNPEDYYDISLTSREDILFLDPEDAVSPAEKVASQPQKQATPVPDSRLDPLMAEILASGISVADLAALGKGGAP